MAKAMADIRSLAREQTPMCIRVLTHVARSPKCPAAARVVAANSLLDRGWGKPDQVHSSPDGGLIQVIIRHIVEHELIDNTIENEPVLIEHEPDRDK